MHLHTPASADWQEPGVTYLQWLQKAESRGLDIVAITDHNTVEGVARLRAEIERLTWLEANDRLRPQERRDLDEYRRLGNKILVLPGFEFTATFGFHVLAIFPPDTPLRLLELLLLRLNVPVDRLAEGSTEVGATADVLTAYRLIDEAGGLVIAAHVNSTHGVAMRGFNFGGQTKIAYTQDPHLHALEVTDLDAPGRRSTAKFFDGTKPEYPRRMHCIQGSDAHRLVRDPKDKNRLGIGDRVTEILLPEVSFEALAAALKGDDFSVTRPYRPLAEEPFDFVLAAREAGNTIVQSFHESMVVEGGRTNRVLADVVAFANTQGGTIYLGVSAVKKGPPRGVENPQETVARLLREIEQDITPPLACRVDTLQSQGVPIVRITVPNGPDKPYALRQTRIYVRQEGETSEAVRDEIVRLVLGREAETVLARQVAERLIAPAADMTEVAEAHPETPAETKPAKTSRRRRRRSAAAVAPTAEAAESPAQPSEMAGSAIAELSVEAVPEEQPAAVAEPALPVEGEPTVVPMAESAAPTAEMSAAPVAGEPTVIVGEAAVGEIVPEPEMMVEAPIGLPEEPAAPEVVEATKPAKRRTRRGRKKAATSAPAEASKEATGPEASVSAVEPEGAKCKVEGGRAAGPEATVSPVEPVAAEAPIGEAQAPDESAAAQVGMAAGDVTLEIGMTGEEAAVASEMAA
ncbi:MAG: RNA-binding domain-containing protein, partial [Anaerolineae bacterium]